MSKMNEKNIKISSYITIITSIFLQKKKNNYFRNSRKISNYITSTNIILFQPI